MNRRVLLAGASLIACCRAFAQPMPVLGPVGGRTGGGGPLFSLGSGPPGKTLDLSFMTPGALDPRVTFTRASTATYFDNTGTMQTAAANAPRWDYNPTTLVLNGLLIEEARTNSLRNSTFQGAVVGTPGTLPTNWSLNANLTALSSQVVGTGTENGIPYMDFRIFGTVTTGGAYVIQLDTTTGITAANAQAWTYTQYWRLVAGTFNGATNPQLGIRECTAAGATVHDNFTTVSAPTGAALNTQRISSGTVTLSGGGTVGMIQPRCLLTMTTSAAVNMTLRIGAPQVELGAFPTSFIPTTAAAVTRAADLCSVQPASMGFYTPPGGSWAAEVIYLNASGIVGVVEQYPSGVYPLYIDTTFHAGQWDNSIGLMNSANVLAPGTVSKGAGACLTGPATICLNGGAVASAAFTTGYAVLGSTGVALMQGAGVGYLRHLSYWPRILANAEMQAVTT